MEEALERRAEALRKAKYKPTRLAVDEFAIHKGHMAAGMPGCQILPDALLPVEVARRQRMQA